MYYRKRFSECFAGRKLCVAAVAVVLAALSGRAEAAITYVNDNTVAATSTTQSSVTGTLTGITAGDMLVAFVTTDQNATITKPSGWVDPGIRADSGASVSLAVYYYPNYPSTSVSATFSFSVADGSGIVQIIELRGVIASSPLDVTATSSGRSRSATLTAGSATTAPGDIALIGWANDTTNRTFGNPVAPWTLINGDLQSQSTDEQGTYYTDISNGTTVTETLTISRTSYWAGVLITFKAAPVYWRGGLSGCASGSAYTSTTCWSTTSGGSSMGTAPLTNDLVIFDSAATGNCALSSTAVTQAYSLTLGTGYTGTVTMGAQNISLKGDLTVTAGTFTGASGKTIATNQSGSYLGGLLVNGGTFNGNGAITNVKGLIVSSGTFTQGSGTFSTNNSGTAVFSGGTSTFSSGTSSFTTTVTTSGAASVTFGSGAPTFTGLATFGGTGSVTFGTGKATFSASLDVEGATVTFGATTAANAVTGTVTVGSGTLNFANGTATTDFSCTDTFTQSGGTVNVNGAQVAFSTGQTGAGDAFTQSGGTFTNTTASGAVTFGSATWGVGDVSQTGASAVYNSSKTETFNGAITVAGSMTLGTATTSDVVSVSSGGTLTLTASTTFTSTTAMTIDGTLNAGPGTTTYNGAVTINGTLDGSSGTQSFANAVTIASGGLYKSGTGTMAGSTQAKKLLTISSGGTMTLASAGFPFSSTNAMTLAGTLNAAGTVSFSGNVTLSGTVNANASTTTFSGTVALSGTYNANSSTTTFSNTVTMSTGSTFNGNTGTTTFSVAPTLTAGTFNVGDAGSTGSVTFAAAATTNTFASGMTLAFPTSGGNLKLPGGSTLAIAGTTTSSAGSATTKPKISRSTGTTGITVNFTGGTFNVDGLEFNNVVSTGVSMASAVTYAKVSNLVFKSNVAAGAAGSRHLLVTLGTATVNMPDCTFDSTAVANIKLQGTSGQGRLARLILEDVSSCTAGTCESYDDDGDANNDNYGDDTTTNPYYGSVIEWVKASPRDTWEWTATVPLGPPVAAFDWNTFTYYGVYAAFTDGASNSRIWMRSSTDGSARYSTSSITGKLIGAPRWDALSEVAVGYDVNGDGDATDTDVRVLYALTSDCHVYKFIDNPNGNGGLGSFDTPGSASAWNTGSYYDNTVCDTATTAPVSDGTNLYFGGKLGTAAKIFGLQLSGGVNEKTMQKRITTTGTGNVNTSPAIGTSSGATYLFAASKAASSQAYIYRVQISPGGTIESSYSTGLTVDVNAMTMVNNRLHAVTAGGKLYEINALNFTAGGFTTYTGFPYSDSGASPIVAQPFVDPFSDYAYFGDSAGKVYIVSKAGVSFSATKYPYTFATGTVGTPLYRKASGTIAVGASDGYVYFLNRQDASGNPQIRKRYFVCGKDPAGANPSATSVTTVSYNSNSSQYMVACNGNMTYIPSADVGTDSDGLE
jgi:hypothetical protein